MGTICTGLFAIDGGLLTGGGSDFLLTQIIGVVTVAIYVAVAMTVVFGILNKAIGLRVCTQEEITGLDMEEHGLASSYADFMPTVSAVSGNVVYTAAPAAAPVQAGNGVKLSKVVIITSQNRFEMLKTALDALGITGMTVTKVLGYGLQKSETELYRGAEVASHLLPKVKVEMVVSAIPVEQVVETARRILYTGQYGDGKIFIFNVEDVVKIRTGETGFDALQDMPVSC